MTAFVNGKILVGDRIVTGHYLSVHDGLITAVSPNETLPANTNTIDLGGKLLAPGYIDIQVNGGGGYLFNDAPSVDTIRKIGDAHKQFGTTGFLPTLISDDLEVIKKAIEAVDEAILIGVPGVLGIHIEGPFLNKDKKGIHDSTKFQTMLESHIPLLSALKHGKTLLTMAPECTPPELISKLTSLGIIVSAGHTNANYEDTRTAIESGMTGFTHLFNAMSAFTSREPGVVGAALEDQNTWCGIIVDGKHVAPTSLKIAFQCKPLSRYILVTDAMPTVGSSSSSFVLQGQTIRVKDRVCISSSGTLAGSDLDMSLAVQNCINMLDVDPVQALKMASINAASFLNLDKKQGQITIGAPANFVLLDDDFNVTQTWIDGR